MHEYDGYETWEYNVGPHHVNEGEVDGEIEFDADELDGTDVDVDE